MPNERENPRPSAQPWSQPDVGVLMSTMQEVPEVLLLAWQQVLAGAPTPTATTWSAQWKQGVGPIPGSPQESPVQGPPPADRNEHSHQAFIRMQREALDFWRRSLQSFRKGLDA
ncbi:hypothetical protein [Vitiosangium sp. GDMCC 1.1324]|uniref:hypothetical protein n=1 Tax=Vitiosangium sp. (strain GDMCC 1.1324) TaxID=2138576 RepID=UPI000D3C0B83|nr:hypothetical protein [Vitiosangium sp. GDMCC 1.1324]PTL83708.1 hypothetical protein DAT35_09510 [Vitiosangium sp. GDMCC 1.1324]